MVQLISGVGDDVNERSFSAAYLVFFILNAAMNGRSSTVAHA
jgi:hypothetical protein